MFPPSLRSVSIACSISFKEGGFQNFYIKKNLNFLVWREEEEREEVGDRDKSERKTLSEREREREIKIEGR